MNLPSIPNLRTFLKDYTPDSPEESIETLELISAVTAVADRLKKASYSVLDTLPETEANLDGLIVYKFTPTKKVFNPSPDVAIAQAALDKAKKDLADAQDEAGFKVVNDKPYWKMKQASSED